MQKKGIEYLSLVPLERAGWCRKMTIAQAYTLNEKTIIQYTSTIHAVKVFINTFPVANKTFYFHVHTYGEMTVGIIPMRTQEGTHFISVGK